MDNPTSRTWTLTEETFGKKRYRQFIIKLLDTSNFLVSLGSVARALVLSLSLQNKNKKEQRQTTMKVPQTLCVILYIISSAFSQK